MSKRSGEIEILARGLCVQDGQVLVCQTAGAKITYLPGGHVEFGESAPVALVRELQEECGVEVRAGALLGVIEHTFIQKGERHCEVNLVFAMQAPTLRPRHPVPTLEAHLSFAWIPLADLAASPLEPAALRSLIPAWQPAPPTAGWASTYG